MPRAKTRPATNGARTTTSGQDDEKRKRASASDTNDRRFGEWNFVLPWARGEGGAGSITFKPDRDGDGRYFIRSRRDSDPSGAEFLRLLVGASVAPDSYHLLDDPLRWLDELIVNVVDEEPAPIPRAERRLEWRKAARTDDRVRRYLRDRGLSRETVRRYKLMYNARRDAIGIPVFERGQLVNIKWRYLDPAPGSPKIMGLRGRGSHLYPAVPGRGPLLLCEGEFDALLMRQLGLPAVTSTAGQTWNDNWDPFVKGRQVAVVYDVGATRGEKVAEHLRAAGADAWSVDLGLPKKGDDLTDWIVKYGRSVDELRQLINRARRSA